MFGRHPVGPCGMEMGRPAKNFSQTYHHKSFAVYDHNKNGSGIPDALPRPTQHGLGPSRPQTQSTQ